MSLFAPATMKSSIALLGNANACLDMPTITIMCAFEGAALILKCKLTVDVSARQGTGSISTTNV